MSTRGAYGFYKNGINKITLNKYDSNPELLGKEIISFLKIVSNEELNDIFNKLKLVNTDTYVDLNGYLKIIEDNKEFLKIYINTPVDIMIDSAEFLKNSLFCEWAYIINLDKNVLEVYKGGQMYPEKNRYYTTKNTLGYYNCRLLTVYPLEFLEENIISDILDIVNKIEKNQGLIN